jgi:HAD superfamily hydrolase (TIGR01509 family)
MRAAIIDIDGTLVDTNYQHALAWHRAFRRHGLTIPVWRIHRVVGMGGDQLVAELAGEDVEEELGDRIRDEEKPTYIEMIEEVEVLDGARELVAELSAERVVVLASSAKEDEVDHYLDLLGARETVRGWTTSADVEATKPDPDLVEAALEKAGTRDAVMVGDTVWDCEAAARAGIPTVAVLSGGYGREELRAAGATEVLETVAELRGRTELLDRLTAPQEVPGR